MSNKSFVTFESDHYDVTYYYTKYDSKMSNLFSSTEVIVVKSNCDFAHPEFTIDLAKFPLVKEIEITGCTVKLDLQQVNHFHTVVMTDCKVEQLLTSKYTSIQEN